MVALPDINHFRFRYHSTIMVSQSNSDSKNLPVAIPGLGTIPIRSGFIALERSIAFTRPGGTVLLFGVPPAGQSMAVEAFEVFRKGLTVLSSFTSVRNSYQAVALLQSRQVDVSGLISHQLPLDAFQQGVELIEKGLEGVKKVLILPNT